MVRGQVVRLHHRFNGRTICVDSVAQIVIARFASHPLADNFDLDPMPLPANPAIADWLLTHPRLAALWTVGVQLPFGAGGMPALCPAT